MKLNKLTSILFLFLLIFSSFLVIFADSEVLISSKYTTSFEYGSVSRTSNGTLLVLSSGRMGGTRALNLSLSYDNGVTWKNVNINTSTVDSLRYITIAVDSTDIIHIAYTIKTATNNLINYARYDLATNTTATTTIALIGTYTFTGCKLIVDYYDNVHISYSYYLITGYGYVKYLKYTKVLNAWSSIQTATFGNGVKGVIGLDMEVDFYSGFCTAFIFYNNLTTNYLVMKHQSGGIWSNEYNIKSCTATILSFKVAYSHETNKIVIVYNNPDDNSIEFVVFYGIDFTFTDAILIYKDYDGFSQEAPVISITSANIVNFIWCGASSSVATTKIRERSYSLITLSFLAEASYLTTGNNVHTLPFVINTMYPNFCKTSAYYLMFYFNDTAKQLVFYDTITPIWLPGGGGGVSTGYKIYIDIYDTATNTKLQVSNKYCISNYLNQIKCNIYSDLWYGDYAFASDYCDITSISIPFIDGSYHTLSLCNINGYVKNEVTFFYNMTVYFQWYNDLTYTFYITPIAYNEGYNNRAFDEQSGLYSYLESDKTSYIYGETIRMRYKIPTTQELQNAGLHTGHWWTCLFRDNPWYMITPSVDDSYHSATTPLLCVEDNQWHFFTFTAPNPSDNIDTYECTIQEPSWWIFYQALITLQNALKFNVYKVGDFIASGNITSISPSTPKLGQQTTITFNANNDGIIKIKHVDSNKYAYINNFVKPLGLATTKFLPSLFGLYSVELYVNNGINYSIVDVSSFFVNETEGGYGKFGTAEFLYIPYRRAIAGLDNITIMYHSLKNNSLLQIKDSTGAIYPASTYVSNIPNTLIMPLPTYAEIGLWNVTLYGNDTLSASFYVIAEEGNYVEFAKHYFYSNEMFKLNIQHTKKVALEFYKDGIPTGKNAILQDNEMPFGVLDIPPDIAPISTGNWLVEMWEINNNIRIKLLASDTCIVIYGKLPSTTPSQGFGISFSGLDAVVKAVVGIIIVVLLTFTPLFFSVMSSKGTNISEIEIPALVYIAMFLFGVFICVLLELFPVGALFFVIFGLIIALAILWVQRKIAD